MGKNQGGRPPIDPGQHRTIRLSLFVNQSELEALDARREEAGIGSRGAYIRTMILGKLRPSVDAGALTLIARTSNNLNQIAKRLNSLKLQGKLQGEPVKKLNQELSDIRETLETIRQHIHARR